MISPALLMLLASAADDQPPPPPKPEPDPEPDLGSRVRLSDASGQEVILDGVEWQFGVDHATSPPTTAAIRVPNGEVAAEGTATIRMRPRPSPVREWPSEPWIPPRRVADPEKKRARKAQKRARRAGR